VERSVTHQLCKTEKRWASLRSTHPADCGLLRFPRKENLRAFPATKQHDGQITKNLSSPAAKNIPLHTQPKSAL
jgi:hypothetical protein